MSNLTPCILHLTLLAIFAQCIAAVNIDCQRPPQLVDPALCCQDGGRDPISESCAKRMGITGQPSDAPPTVETATCLAECILAESHYMPQPENLSVENIRADLQQRFGNDSVYVQTMVESFRRCQPTVQRKMQAFRQMPLGKARLQRTGSSGGCSPYAGMMLGCTYMEYFKNCPAHRWTESPECALAKQFVTQCGLGA